MASAEATFDIRFLQFEDLDGAALYALLKLRFDVFILEQESIYPELDDQDQAALHCVCYQKDAPIGTLRLLNKGDVHIWSRRRAGRSSRYWFGPADDAGRFATDCERLARQARCSRRATAP